MIETERFRYNHALELGLPMLKMLQEYLPELKCLGGMPDADEKTYLNNLPRPLLLESAKYLGKMHMLLEDYYKAFHMPVFSCDSGLYFDGVEETAQPGTHIRRVNGKELTDEEMIEYYGGWLNNTAASWSADRKLRFL